MFVRLFSFASKHLKKNLSTIEDLWSVVQFVIKLFGIGKGLKTKQNKNSVRRGEEGGGTC